MNDPSPPVPQTPVYRSNAPVVLRIILAILLGIPGIVGLCVLAAVFGMWISDGFRFSGSVWLLPVFLIGAESFVCFSVLTIGIVLRFARWKRAPTASLALAVLSAVAIVIGYQLLLDCLQADDGDDRLAALVFSILGLIVISVPPFLHWMFAKRRSPSTQASANDISRAP